MSDEKDNTASGVQATLAAERTMKTTLPGFGPDAKIVTDLEAKVAYDHAVEYVTLTAGRERANSYDPYAVLPK